MTPPAKIAILFVCMGNICRSPTAEVVLRQRAQRHALADQLHIDSAGTDGWHAGEAPDARSQQHARQRGYDLSSQRARQVAARDFADFDHILAMDHDNLARLRAQCPPQHRHKLALFMQYAPHSGSEVVPDPYYGGAQGFEQVLDYCEQASDGLLAALLRPE